VPGQARRWHVWQCQGGGACHGRRRHSGYGLPHWHVNFHSALKSVPRHVMLAAVAHHMPSLLHHGHLALQHPFTSVARRHASTHNAHAVVEGSPPERPPEPHPPPTCKYPLNERCRAVTALEVSAFVLKSFGRLGGPALTLLRGTRLTRRCSLADLASLGPPSSRGSSGSSSLPLAGATRPCVGRARTSRCEPQAGPRCAVSPSPRQRWLRPVKCLVCGSWVLVRLGFAPRSHALCRLCAL
jgi:hypothetical protein